MTLARPDERRAKMSVDLSNLGEPGILAAIGPAGEDSERQFWCNFSIKNWIERIEIKDFAARVRPVTGRVEDVSFFVSTCGRQREIVAQGVSRQPDQAAAGSRLAHPHRQTIPPQPPQGCRSAIG